MTTVAQALAALSGLPSGTFPQHAAELPGATGATIAEALAAYSGLTSATLPQHVGSGPVPQQEQHAGTAHRHYVPSFKKEQSQNWFKINRAKMLDEDDDEVAIMASISVIFASAGLEIEEVEYANA
jgi:hypothetical protein